MECLPEGFKAMVPHDLDPYFTFTMDFEAELQASSVQERFVNSIFEAVQRDWFH